MRHVVSLRGNALLITLVALAILLVLVSGAISFTGANRSAAASKLVGDELSSCADAARRHLLANLRVRVPATEVTLSTQGGTRWKELPSGAVGERTIVSISHYEQDPATAPGTVAVVPAAAMVASRRQVQSLENRIAPPTFGGYYRVVMKCREQNPVREAEVEFVFRYGL